MTRCLALRSPVCDYHVDSAQQLSKLKKLKPGSGRGDARALRADIAEVVMKGLKSILSSTQKIP